MKPAKVYLPLDTSYPFLGLDTTDPSTMLDPRRSPRLLNIEFDRRSMKKRAGYSALGGDLWVSDDPFMEISRFITSSGTRRHVAFTTHDRYLYDTSSEQWILMGALIQDCDSAADWTASANVTLASETTIKKLGTGSLKATVADAFTTGIFAYANFPAKDLTEKTSLGFWFYSTSTWAAGALSLVLSETADGAKTGSYETFLLPAYATANAWQYMVVDGDFTTLNAVVSIGIWIEIDQTGSKVFYLDDIKALRRWTGDEDNIIDMTSGYDLSGKYIMVTNGKDFPLWWNGSDEDFLKMEIDIANFVTCKAIEIFNDRVFLANITTSSIDTQTIVWCAAGDFTDWTGVDTGAALISSADGDILQLLELSGRLMIYAENSISSMTNVGGDVLYAFERVVRGTRLASQKTIVDVGAYHLYMSSEGFYLFDGSPNLFPIGTMVVSKFQTEADLSLIQRAFAQYDPIKSRAYWSVPSSSTTSLLFVLDIDLSSQSRFEWTVYSLKDNPTAFGFFERDASLAWNSAALAGVTWTDMAGSWEASAFRSDFPLRIVGSIEKIYLHDGTTKSDRGEAIDGYWESMDYTVPQVYMSLYARWIELELELKGTSADICYSLDQGATFVKIETLELSSTWTRYKCYVDVHSQTFRFQIRNTGTDSFELRWLRVWFTPMGDN
jgi:hypothetical protein